MKVWIMTHSDGQRSQNLGVYATRLDGWLDFAARADAISGGSYDPAMPVGVADGALSFRAGSNVLELAPHEVVSRIRIAP